jgi:lysophospholipase L1-like esterase
MPIRQYRPASLLDRSYRICAAFFLLTLPICPLATAQKEQRAWKFDCSVAVHRGAERLSADTLYRLPSQPASRQQPYPEFGFDLGLVPSDFAGNSCSSAKPFFFSISVPDGNYQVTLYLGGPFASSTTVRAESRRLFVDQMHVPAGGSRRIVFNVNVRSVDIVPSADMQPTTAPLKVKIKPREVGALDWDNKLTLEFNGDQPSVRSIQIKRVNVPTLYIAGDSTVVDQTEEPWAAWGQMLPLFFGPRIAIANEAESGETIRSFIGERRLDKIMSTIRPGDYLMLQFGHNDQKQGSGYVPAATEFKTYLLRYIAEARAHGATPILVTPMNRRSFDVNGKIVQTLGDYPAAMREVALQQKVALIDLNALSKTLFEAMGESGTLHAFVHYPANTFPGQTTELKDNTHFNSYGAYELARSIVQSIRSQKLPLAHFLRSRIPPFDPARPDPITEWQLPPSPGFSVVTPYSR